MEENDSSENLKINKDKSLVQAKGVESAFENLTNSTSTFDSLTGVNSAFENLRASTNAFDSLTGVNSAFENLRSSTNTLASFTGVNSALGNLRASTSALDSLTGVNSAFENLRSSTNTFASLTGVNSALGNLRASTSALDSLTGVNSAFENLRSSTNTFTSLTGINSALESLRVSTNTFDSLKGVSSVLENLRNSTNSVFDSVKGISYAFENFRASTDVFKIVSGVNPALSISSFYSMSENVNQVLDRLTVEDGILDKFNAISEILNSPIEEIEDQDNNEIVQNSELEALLIDLKKQLEKLNKPDLFNKIGIWCTVISFIVMLFQLKLQYDAPTPDELSVQQIKLFKIEINKVLNENIKNYTSDRLITSRCKLLIKPKLRTSYTKILIEGERVSVINTNKKWALVICLDSDGLPVTGWVLKKYLGKRN